MRIMYILTMQGSLKPAQTLRYSDKVYLVK